MEQRRVEARRYGVLHRERLVATFMEREGLTQRPALKEIAEQLVEDVQGARLMHEVLPLDRYAQTERVGSRVVVSINTRIAEMEGIKDAAGIALVALFHESIHVADDFAHPGDEVSSHLQGLPGFEVELPRLVVCRGPGEGLRGAALEREFWAENAGLAAAICGEDLARSPAFARLQERAALGGELGTHGWNLLYSAAGDVGVNASALIKHLGFVGALRVEKVDGRNRLLAAPNLFQELP